MEVPQVSEHITLLDVIDSRDDSFTMGHNLKHNRGRHWFDIIDSQNDSFTMGHNLKHNIGRHWFDIIDSRDVPSPWDII